MNFSCWKDSCLDIFLHVKVNMESLLKQTRLFLSESLIPDT